MIASDEIDQLSHEVRAGLGLLPFEARSLVRMRCHRVVWSDVDARGWSPGEAVRIEAAKSLIGDANEFSMFEAVTTLDADGFDALLAALRSVRGGSTASRP